MDLLRACINILEVGIYAPEAPIALCNTRAVHGSSSKTAKADIQQGTQRKQKENSKKEKIKEKSNIR